MPDTTVAPLRRQNPVVRAFLVAGVARSRMHLRRLLAGFPGTEVVGHAHSGARTAELLKPGGIDIILVDAAEDPASAIETLDIIANMGIALLVLVGEDPIRLPLNAFRAKVLRRPSELQSVLPQSPFCRELQEALSHVDPAKIGKPSASYVLKQRGFSPLPPALIAIGSSTGGPQALPHVLAPLGARLRQPVVITQHMPAAFTALLAEHLTRHTSMTAVQATEGMPILPGRIHIAPGGRHLLLMRKENQVVCSLDDGPPENFCKPAVDPMLRSIVAIYGGRALAVILTGMGHDGREGCRALAGAGGTVLAQDEESSVVWGMPGAVAQAGLCQAILPLNDIAAKILALAGGSA
jgi:two-component system, chemotaxis family, protein-glutamate methylesterase/glutaminase